LRCAKKEKEEEEEEIHHRGVFIPVCRI